MASFSASREFCSTSSTVVPISLISLHDPRYLGDHKRRKAHGRLVQQQQLRPAHDRAGDGQHLLLAAAEGARPAGARVSQAREVLSISSRSLAVALWSLRR